MRVVLVSGTWAKRPGWIFDPLHPFRVMLEREGVSIARDDQGEPFQWPAMLSGLPFVNPGHWKDHGLRLLGFCVQADCYNVIAHSHGGQVAIHALAASPERFRVLTTVGTPIRADVPAGKAARNVGYWQHVYDPEKDWMATLPKRLGGVGDGNVSLRRTFKVPGVVNIAIPGVRHSKIFEEPNAIDQCWRQQGVLEAIRVGVV